MPPDRSSDSWEGQPLKTLTTWTPFVPQSPSHTLAGHRLLFSWEPAPWGSSVGTRLGRGQRPSFAQGSAALAPSACGLGTTPLVLSASAWGLGRCAGQSALGPHDLIALSFTTHGGGGIVLKPVLWEPLRGAMTLHQERPEGTRTVTVTRTTRDRGSHARCWRQAAEAEPSGTGGGGEGVSPASLGAAQAGLQCFLRLSPGMGRSH